MRLRTLATAKGEHRKGNRVLVGSLGVGTTVVGSQRIRHRFGKQQNLGGMLGLSVA